MTSMFKKAKGILRKVDAKEEERKKELREIRKQNTKVSIFFGGNVGGLQRQRATSIKEIPETNKMFGRDMTWAVIAPDSSWKSKWDYLIIIFVHEIRVFARPTLKSITANTAIEDVITGMSIEAVVAFATE